MQPKQPENCASQGDLRFFRIKEIPQDAKEKQPEDGKIIAGHSETGHNHFIDALKHEAKWFERKSNPDVCFLQITGEYADVEHGRTVNKHETHRLPKGNWCVVGQRESTLMGEIRRVMD